MANTLFPLSEYNVEKFSYSQLKLFSQCKFRYKLKYTGDKIQQDQRTTFYHSIGRSVHNFFEKYTQSVDYSLLSDDVIEKFLNESWISVGFEDKNDEEKWFFNSLRMIKNFLCNEQYHRNPLVLEKTFSTRLDNYEISSRIDRIDRINETECEIIDYKIGKNELDIDELEGDLQWAFHYLSSYFDLTESYHLNIKRITFIFLDAEQVETFIPDNKQIVLAKREIIQQINEIKKEEIFEPKMNKYCIDCRFDLICPLIQELKNKNVDINDYLD